MASWIFAFARMTRLHELHGAQNSRQAGSPRRIRRIDSVIQLYRLGWLFSYPYRRGILTRGQADRFCAKFPAPVEKAETIPCSRELIPCSSAQGILSQMSEFADVFVTDFRKKGLNRRNSLHLSLPPGNSRHSGDVKSIRGEPPRSPTVGNGACSKNTHLGRDRGRQKSHGAAREGSFGRRPPDLFYWSYAALACLGSALCIALR